MKEYRKKRISLKYRIIVAILIVILALGGAAWIVLVTADQSISSTKASLSISLVGLNEAISDDKLSSADKISSMSAYLSQLAIAKKGLCNQDKNDLISVSLRFTSGCADKSVTLNKIIDTSNILAGMIKDDNYLSTIINKSSASDSIHDLAINWSDIAKKVSDYKVSDSLKDEKQKLSVVIETYANTWKALDAADNSQDKTAFDTSRDSINTTYTQITKYNDIFHAQTAKTVELLNEQIRLFNS